MQFRTIGNSAPKGKPKVYFTGHPADCKAYFDEISEMILKQYDCVIFYDKDPEHPDDEENFASDLESMQLVVIVVSGRYVYEDTFAHNVVFRQAVEKHIPVLPILEERGIEEDFNTKCGDLQYLDPNSKDTTEVSFEEKLNRFLSSVLVGDELAKKVRAAFDAYVFLSYRKKDRRYAQELMRLIHKNDFCRDIAIWYDEFLVPGENFNDAIREAMEKSELFALAITPSLLEDANYIMKTEYPAAKDLGKKILPAVLVPTDDDMLKACYESIPDPIESSDTIAMSEALRKALENIAKRENDNDPQHNFFIGLAYLGGIDVEVDHSRALSLITSSAEAGLKEAITKLVSMYQTGEGVRRSYETAIEWQRRLVSILEHESDLSQNVEDRSNYLFELCWLGDLIFNIGHIAEASEIYKKLLEASEEFDRLQNDDQSKDILSVSYDRMGDISKELGDLYGARAYFEKSLEIDKQLAENTVSERSQRELFFSYGRLGDINEELGYISQAKTHYEKGFEISKSLAEQTGTVDSQTDLASSYDHLGEMSKASENFSEARAYFEKSFEIRKRIAEQTQTLDVQGDLVLSYDKLGSLCRAEEKLSEAKDYFEKGLEITERLAQQTETVLSRRNLAVNYDTLGGISIALGDISQAEAYFEKSLEIRKQLAEQTDSISSQSDLAVSYDQFGEIYRIANDFSKAEEYFEKSLEIRERLAERSDSVELQRYISVSCYRLGKLNILYGIVGIEEAFSEAKEYYRRSLEINKRLAERLGTADAQRRLAESYNDLGSLSRQCKSYEDTERQLNELSDKARSLNGQADTREGAAPDCNDLDLTNRLSGDLSTAREYYEKGFEINKRLAERTYSVQSQKALAASYDNLGDVSMDDGDLTLARTYYEKSFEIKKRIYEQTGSLGSQRELAVGYEQYGELCEAVGDIFGAREYYEKGLEIRMSLVEKIQSVDEQNGITFSMNKLHRICKSLEEMQTCVKRFEAFWISMTEKYPSEPTFAERLESVRRLLR